MSEPKGPFEAVTGLLKEDLIHFRAAFCPGTLDNIQSAIRVLEAVPKIRETIVEFLEWGPMTGSDLYLHESRFRALLESLPEPGKEVEEEPKRYRCESCGKDFDKKTFSHSRTEENQVGEPVEVECGPISEVK